ncbi:glycoside hydrolase family protein [Acinetobacter baumannii]|uniref:glycoside hydrolase family protein n=1 Tax=Acinetobacter baumannii TaxID=470 RepID=UPI0020C13D99|nr:tail tape measure protein [Acinetobacter baumannii]MCL6164808.1 tail tape measure protein [Acinetobacter baumannii]MCL6168028.1 tail tape measure protein [Acinetobacter baumannii]MCL6172374.1 tail tape measure protein [Acinetobacter baumannii]MCL6192749.1 tail tape measure protein [Acinetobacter baumannii]MCL6196273.1 tail tape measure protein [Acinetobacter baumannii]
MTDSNHNNPVLSYDELGFIIGMKRVEKKVSTIDSNIEKIIDILTQSFEEQKVQLAQPQPKLTEFQKMLNAVNNRQALDFEDLLKEKANPITHSFVVADKLVKDFADILEQSVDDLKTVEKKHINQPKSLKPAIEINSHEDLSKIVNPSVPERDEKGRFVSNPNETQNQSSIRKVAQTITTAIKGVMPNSPQGVDPTVDAINEVGHLLTPVRRAAGLAMRPLTGFMRSRKRNEPLPREQENHNRKQIKLLQRIADNLASKGGLLGSLGKLLTTVLSAGSGLLGGVLGKGRKGIGKLGKGLGKVLKFGRGLPVIGALAAGASLLDWNEQSTQEKGGTVGSLAGGVIGGTVGSLFGPVGTLIGGMAGSWIGNKLGTVVAPYFKEWTDSLIAADVPGIINTAWKGFVNYATNAFELTKGTASKVVDGVKDTASDTLDFIKDKFNRFNPFHDGVPTWGIGQGVYKPGFGANKNVPAYGSTNSKALKMIGNDTVERASSLLRKFEGYSDTAYWDVNAHRVGYGSDTVTDEHGKVRKVTANTKVKKSDAERDLARRTKIFAAEARSKVGEKVWDNLPMDTQAALTSVAYNYGSLPKSVVKAVKTGNIEEISKSVRNLQHHNNGINFNRRNAEADIIKNSKSNPSNVKKSTEGINKVENDSNEIISFSNKLEESKKSIKQVLATKPAILPTVQKSPNVNSKLKTQFNTAVQPFKQPLNTPNPQEVVVVNGSNGNISQNVNDRYLAHALTGGIGMGKLDV